jgi:cation:H+ antiporter
LFVLSLAGTLFAARMFARRLDRLGLRFGFPEALVGLLSALAADGPEISSALFALAKGAHGVSIGVLVGSNTFNLAAMIGVSGLLAGSVSLARDTLLLEGLIGAAITAMGAAVLLGWLDPLIAALAGACVVVPYLLLIVGGSELILAKRTRPTAHLVSRLADALAQRPQSTATRELSSDPTHHLLVLIVLDVALIIAGSAGMVQSALALAGRWHISNVVLGVLILAPLTSIPNAITGVRLGISGRSAALVGETFNSNSLNLGAGVIVPSLFLTLGALSALAKFQLSWLLVMTGLSLAMLLPRRGMRRAQAAFLILLYLLFVVISLAWS